MQAGTSQRVTKSPLMMLNPYISDKLIKHTKKALSGYFDKSYRG